MRDPFDKILFVIVLSVIIVIFGAVACTVKRAEKEDHAKAKACHPYVSVAAFDVNEHHYAICSIDETEDGFDIREFKVK